MPIVSVIIPTFGRPALVCRAIRSVLAQTLSDLEVIVVVDGDDPATLKSLAELRELRVRWIISQQKRGASQARDSGAEEAKGHWVAFLDDDDEWHPEKLTKQLACAPTEPAIITCLSDVVSSYGVFVRPSEPYDNRLPIDEWLFDRRTWTKGGGGFLQTSSLLMPRTMFNVIRFADTEQHEEWELVIRAVKSHGYKLITVPESLVTYYVPEKRKSLSQTYTWRKSLDWAMGLKGLLSRRAFSGFCLTVLAQMAASLNARDAFGPLLRAAFRYGAPTVKQLFAFLYFWLSPTHLRNRIRAFMQSKPKHV